MHDGKFGTGRELRRAVGEPRRGGWLWVAGPIVGFAGACAIILVLALTWLPEHHSVSVPLPPLRTDAPGSDTLIAGPPNPKPVGLEQPLAPPAEPAAAGQEAVPPAEPTWLRNAVAASPSGGRPRIAVIIDDVGLDRRHSDEAVALPGPVTLSYLAYAPDLPHQTEAARAAGHELLVHVPMEPISRQIDMGPNGLDTALPPEEVLRRLRWDLDRFDGYVGINNHMGSRFTGDAKALTPVIEELKSRGLLFIDSRTVGNSAGTGLARSIGVPFAARDVFLDDEQTADGVAARLRDVEAVARRRGTAIAIGHPHEATLLALERWLPGLEKKGFVLVPVSDVVKARNGAD